MHQNLFSRETLAFYCCCVVFEAQRKSTRCSSSVSCARTTWRGGGELIRGWLCVSALAYHTSARSTRACLWAAGRLLRSWSKPLGLGSNTAGLGFSDGA